MFFSTNEGIYIHTAGSYKRGRGAKSARQFDPTARRFRKNLENTIFHSYNFILSLIMSAGQRPENQKFA